MSVTPNPGLAAARRMYERLIRAYPRSFRESYGPWMLQLFCDQYRAASLDTGRAAWARFWLRILGDLAASVVREHLDELRRPTMVHEGRGSFTLGMLLFVLLGAAVIVINTPAPAGMWSVFPYLGFLLWFGSYLVALGLVLWGWLAGFPRWVYPYLGYVVVFSLYLSYASTPGVEFFGVPLFGRELWGWRAYVPLGLVCVVAVSLSRPPWGNLVRLFANVWDDWTLAVFAFFGLLPLASFVSLEEVEHTFAFWPILAGVVLIGLGALLYLRLGRPWQRCLALLACAALAIAIMSGSAAYYWDTHYVNLSTGVRRDLGTPAHWPKVLRSAVWPAIAVAVFLLLPLPLALVHRAYTWLRSRRAGLA